MVQTLHKLLTVKYKLFKYRNAFKGITQKSFGTFKTFLYFSSSLFLVHYDVHKSFKNTANRKSSKKFLNIRCSTIGKYILLFFKMKLRWKSHLWWLLFFFYCILKKKKVIEKSIWNKIQKIPSYKKGKQMLNRILYAVGT